MDPSSLTLPEVNALIWRLLLEGSANSHHPFHTPNLGTLSLGGAPSIRTVVLRFVDPKEGQVNCHTDIRSEKVAQIRDFPRVFWHFYSPADKIQIRAEAGAEIHYQDEYAREVWERTPLSSRRIYLLDQAPATPSEITKSGMPAHLQGRVPTPDESESGWPNFAVVRTRIVTIDWLYLLASGHLRVQFKRTPSTQVNQDLFQGQWVTP